MGKVFLSVVILSVSLSLSGQTYPFSIVKTGTGNQSVLFIPGFACSGDVWQETVEELKENYTCYVLTMAGFSDVPPSEDASFENWYKQIARFIQEKKIEKPILVGHSMGGALALAIAAGYPDLTQKIIVVDALPCLPALTNPHFKPKPEIDYSTMLCQITEMNEEQFAHMLTIQVTTLTTGTPRFDEIVKWGLRSDKETYAKMFCDFSNTDLRECIQNIRVPSLILLEPSFKNIEIHIQEQYKNLSTGQIKYANKGLHFVMFDDKEWFISQVHEFIKE